MLHRVTLQTTSLAAFLFGAVLLTRPVEATSPSQSAHRSEIASPKVELPDLPIPQREISQTKDLERLEHVPRRVRSGDTLSKLIGQLGLSRQERQLWLRAIQKQFSPKRLGAGREIHFYFKRPAAEGPAVAGSKSLMALEIEVKKDTLFSWERSSKGIVFSKRSHPQETVRRVVSGVVASSFFEDGQKLGLSSSLLVQLAEIFAGNIDFDRDIREGDTFKLLYEIRTRNGKEDKRSFRVLVAELMSLGEKHVAFYFEKKKGQGNYYDQYGRSLARAFLRFPVEFSRISSPFVDARFHPFFKEQRPHNGVDFAAPRGTPVRAVADGAIRFAGWKNGGYGRTIKIHHDAAYGSLYAHLERLAPGIRKGAKVKKGQIIGFVGSSGRTTGPHLHFELHRDGELLDPLSFDFPPEDRIDPDFLNIFEDAKQLLLAQLAAARSS